MSKKRKKKTFRQRYKSMTRVGRTLGMTGRQLGAKLKEMGLRETDGAPTQAVLDEGLAVSTPLKDGTPHYMWDAAKLRKRLAEQGIERDAKAVADLKIRETIADIAKLIESEDFEMGGGLGYKIVLDCLFTDYLPQLPLPHNLKQVRHTIHKSHANKDTKDYMLLLANSRCASSEKLDDATARYIIESESDWRVLEDVSRNTVLGDAVRDEARQKYLSLAPSVVSRVTR